MQWGLEPCLFYVEVILRKDAGYGAPVKWQPWGAVMK